MKWKKVKKGTVPPLQDILFTDGKLVYAGLLETYILEEDLLFFDCLSREWIDDITHWMPLPKPPLEEESQVEPLKRDDSR